MLSRFHLPSKHMIPVKKLLKIVTREAKNDKILSPAFQNENDGFYPWSRYSKNNEWEFSPYIDQEFQKWMWSNMLTRKENLSLTMKVGWFFGTIFVTEGAKNFGVSVSQWP